MAKKTKTKIDFKSDFITGTKDQNKAQKPNSKQNPKLHNTSPKQTGSHKNYSTDQKRLDAKHLKQFSAVVRQIFHNTGNIHQNTFQGSSLVAGEVARIYHSTFEALHSHQAKKKLGMELEKLSASGPDSSHIDFLEVNRMVAHITQSEQDLPKHKRQELIEQSLQSCTQSIQKALGLIFPHIWVDTKYVIDTMEEHLKMNFKKVMAGNSVKNKLWWKEVSELVVACYLVLYSRLLDGNRQQRQKVLAKIENNHLREKIAEIVDKSLHDIVASGHMVSRILHLEAEPRLNPKLDFGAV